MHEKYPNLFSPITVGGVTYKNRIFEAPATPIVLQGDEPYPTEQYTDYYCEKAKGGSANVCVAGHTMNPNGPSVPGFSNLDLRNPHYTKYWAQFMDKIHFYGAKCSIELLSFMYSGWTGGKRGAESTSSGPSMGRLGRMARSGLPLPGRLWRPLRRITPIVRKSP